MSFIKDILKDYFEAAVRFWKEEDTNGASPEIFDLNEVYPEEVGNFLKQTSWIIMNLKFVKL